jgi:hypothetical protein
VEGANLLTVKEKFIGSLSSPFFTLYPKGTFSATGHFSPEMETIKFKFMIHLKIA